jgi:hypothetical protein
LGTTLDDDSSDDQTSFRHGRIRPAQTCRCLATSLSYVLKPDTTRGAPSRPGISVRNPSKHGARRPRRVTPCRSRHFSQCHRFSRRHSAQTRHKLPAHDFGSLADPLL